MDKQSKLNSRVDFKRKKSKEESFRFVEMLRVRVSRKPRLLAKRERIVVRARDKRDGAKCVTWLSARISLPAISFKARSREERSFAASRGCRLRFHQLPARAFSLVALSLSHGDYSLVRFSRSTAVGRKKQSVNGSRPLPPVRRGRFFVFFFVFFFLQICSPFEGLVDLNFIREIPPIINLSLSVKLPAALVVEKFYIVCVYRKLRALNWYRHIDIYFYCAR